MGYGEFVIGESKIISFDPSQLLGAKGYTRGYKFDTVKVFNPLTSPVIEKKMQVWEETESPRTVTYTIPSKLKTVAQFATGVGIGLGVGSLVASKIVAACIEANKSKLEVSYRIKTPPIQHKKKASQFIWTSYGYLFLY